MSLTIDTLQEQKQVNGRDFPLLVTPGNDADALSFESLPAWFERNKAELHTKLIEHGAILLRGFPVDSPEAFEKMLDLTDYKNMPYVGGAAPRTQVTQSRIVTANESPASEKIPFHHEMAQTPHPPGYIFFYCDIASETGGATSILHSGEICQRFFEIDEAFASKVEEQGVRYIRVMPPVTDTQSAIGRSWRETFQVETKAACEEKLREHGMEWEWLDGDNLKTISKPLPAIRFDDETQQKTFFNSIIAVYTGWDDARNEGRKAVVTADGEVMDEAVMAKTVSAMDDLAVNFAWQPGDVLLINNHTVLHARQPFTGERRILASIAYK